MTKRQDRFVALLRGINVGGHNKIPMVELRSLCTDIGWCDVETYIQSGNVVFSAPSRADVLEAEIERSIEKRFGHSISVIVRSAHEWPAYVQGNPFPDISRAQPNAVLMGLSKLPLRANALALLQERAAAGEQLAQVGEALWIYYGAGVAKSKLSPGMFDRFAGSPVTARNWRTVVRLGEMLSGV